MRSSDGKKKGRRLSDRQLASLFRVLAFLACALPPCIRAMMLFPLWREERVIRIQAGFGVGTILAIVICAYAFRKTIIATVKKNVGVMPLLVSSAFYILFIGLRKLAPYVPRLEEIAFYAVIGCLISWAFSALAVHFQLKGGILNGNAEP